MDMKKVLFIVFAFLLLGCSDDSGVLPPNNNPLSIAAQDSANTWVYIADEDMYSRNGSTTGYLASVNPTSTKVMVYFQGGGACFNSFTCNTNEDHFDATDGANFELFANSSPPALFNRNLVDNAYKDWSFVFIPYSTGDVHSGSNSDADVPNGGPQNQNMNGYANFTEVIADLKGHFGNGITDFIVTGSSAGGYGTYLNFHQMAQAFPTAQKTGLVDAGPMLLDENVFANCLANVWDNLFQFNYPTDYDSIVTGTYGQKVQGVYEYLAKKYPSANFGLMSDDKDAVIRAFFGFGSNNCDADSMPSTNAEFEAALEEVRLHLTNYNNWNVFYVDDTEHTFLGGRFKTVAVGGKVMADWMEDVRAGTAIDVVP